MLAHMYQTIPFTHIIACFVEKSMGRGELNAVWNDRRRRDLRGVGGIRKIGRDKRHSFDIEYHANDENRSHDLVFAFSFAYYAGKNKVVEGCVKGFRALRPLN